MANLVLATCQFPIQKQIEKNLSYIIRQLKQSKEQGAHLVHFSEACLSGYLGSEVKSAKEINWESNANASHKIMSLAKELGLWVVVGSNHQLSGKHKPHNSLYVINSQGKLINRYDKMFCCGANYNDADLLHYSPGRAFVTFRLRKMLCGLLICHDFRYPELFREYKKRGVQLMLVSFHNAGGKLKDYHNYNTWVSATLQSAAASNYFTISATNGTRKYAWPSFVSSAEGIIVDRAKPHRPAVLINHIDTTKKLYDASAAWRNRCIKGIYHSGKLIEDPRSQNRQNL